MKKILATDGLDKSAVEILEKNGLKITEQHYPEDELKEEIKKYDAVIVRSATKIRKPIIDAALETGNLQLIIRAGVGLDNIDVEYAEEKGITVTNTPNASSPSVAELVIAHMFVLARHLHMSNLTMRRGEWRKKEYQGIELAGKTLGLVGFGRIAKEVAKKAHALGMEVIYTDILGPAERYDHCKFVTLDEILTKSTFISVHTPGSEDGAPVLGPKEFEKMNGVYLINAARGGVVCEKSLLSALDSDRIISAALDVFEKEPTPNEVICSHDKISLTPHIGASTMEAQERIGEEVVQIILNY